MYFILHFFCHLERCCYYYGLEDHWSDSSVWADKEICFYFLLKRKFGKPLSSWLNSKSSELYSHSREGIVSLKYATEMCHFNQIILTLNLTFFYF